MNPSNPYLLNRTTNSPALFKRLVIDLFEKLEEQIIWQVAKEFTKDIKLSDESFDDNNQHDETWNEEINRKHTFMISSIVCIHSSIKKENIRLCKNVMKYNFITSWDYLKYIYYSTSILSTKKERFQE